MVKFNGSVFSLVFRHSVHHLPPQTTSARGGKSDSHSQFQIYVNLWRGVGRGTFELLRHSSYKYLTLFFPPKGKNMTPRGQKFPFLCPPTSVAGRISGGFRSGRLGEGSFEFLPRKLALSSQTSSELPGVL